MEFKDLWGKVKSSSLFKKKTYSPKLTIVKKSSLTKPAIYVGASIIGLASIWYLGIKPLFFGATEQPKAKAQTEQASTPVAGVDSTKKQDSLYTTAGTLAKTAAADSIDSKTEEQKIITKNAEYATQSLEDMFKLPNNSIEPYTVMVIKDQGSDNEDILFEAPMGKGYVQFIDYAGNATKVLGFEIFGDNKSLKVGAVYDKTGDDSPSHFKCTYIKGDRIEEVVSAPENIGKGSLTSQANQLGEMLETMKYIRDELDIQSGKLEDQINMYIDWMEGEYTKTIAKINPAELAKAEQAKANGGSGKSFGEKFDNFLYSVLSKIHGDF